MRDASSTRDTLEKVRPEYVFHLAAQSFVPTSWSAPTESLTTNILGQLNIFEAIRSAGIDPLIQIAGSSEEYGLVYPDEVPMRETNPLRPLSLSQRRLLIREQSPSTRPRRIGWKWTGSRA